MYRKQFIFLGIVAALGLEASASAAEIQILKGDAGKSYISISGRIEQQDASIFADAVRSSRADTVILDSPGGSAGAAMEIGRLIRARGMSTVVTRSGYCVSACGLVWVAGARRILTPGARVGFHATFTTRDNMRMESGVGNALIGRYLTLLNLPERAVVFATTAAPEKLNWLDGDNKGSSGIDLETVESDYPGQVTVASAVKSADLPKSLPGQESERLAFQKR
ncbi:COG3904 family protein [Sandarakinorhabdus oryzae]|uniref:COG3904 family protein n=1 Tax=Sandarakinorhabdus oryzae TaxID=2675220 RepID=UPI0018CC51E4|nr:hypothetical protein [Sandarakinorhabdus oryzae]